MDAMTVRRFGCRMIRACPRAALWPVLLLFVASLALAADLSMSLRPTAGEVGQTVELSVTIEGATNVESEPRLPPVDGLRFRRAGQQTNFSLINGKMSRSITFQFLVVADKPGDYTLGPVEIAVGGETLRSEKATLQIVAAGTPLPGRTAPPGSAGRSGTDGLVFAEAEVDRSEVYLGEQVTLRLRFYQAVGYRVLETQLETPPSTQGFLREEIPPQRSRTATVDGRSYQVTELVYGLFPTQTGTLEIGPASLRCIVQDRRSRGGRRDPFDLFGLFEEREVTLQSRPVRVTVLPLPKPQPDSFTGGVGAFRLDSNVDRTEVNQNEPVTVTFAIEGVGNVAAIGPPPLPAIPGFRSFEGAAPAVEPTSESDRLGGKKVFQFVLVPETAGTLLIPPLELSYFRPGSRSYETLATDSVTVRVLPGSGPGSGGGAGDVARLGWDLRTNRATTDLRPRQGSPWTRVSFWLVQAGPLALLAAVLLARRRRDIAERDRARISRERAPGKLRREIEALGRVADTPEDRLRELDDVWVRFLADRFDFALRGRTREELARVLSSRGVPGEVIAELDRLFGDLDFARFAPGDAGTVGDLLHRSAGLAERLEPYGGATRRRRWGRVPSVSLVAVAIGLLFSDPFIPIPLRERVASAAPIPREDATARFVEGNAAFDSGDVHRAVELYEGVVGDGWESPEVWLNLGNAYYRAGKKGWAVHAYESGLRLAPRDPDLRSNLELAERDTERGADVPSNPALERLAASRSWLPLGSALPLLAVFSWAFAAWGAFALWRRTVGRALVLLGVAIGLLWLGGLAWLGVLAVQAGTRPDAVVVAESAAVRSNPEARATVEFHLPEGVRFRVGRTAPGFVEVLFSDELRGWTEAGNMARIGEPRSRE